MYKPVDAQFQARAMRTGTAAWVLQRLSGLFLTVYLITHLIVIGTAVRGEASFDRLLSNFEKTPFLVLDAGLVGVVAFHGLNGLRLILLDFAIGLRFQKVLFLGFVRGGGGRLHRHGCCRAQPSLRAGQAMTKAAEVQEETATLETPWAVVGSGFWAWVLQRVTAIGLVVLLPMHIVVNHLANISKAEEGILPGLVVFSDVAERFETPAYWAIDLLLLSFVLYHGLNGVRNVAMDYGLRGMAEKAVTGVLSLVGVGAFVFGVTALAAFID